MGQSMLDKINRPTIETDGNRSVVISGKCAIVMYSAEEMRIGCGGLTVQICGTELELQSLDETEISICGCITEISFLTEEGRHGC